MKRNQFLIQRRKKKARSRPIYMEFFKQHQQEPNTSRKFLDKSTRYTQYKSIIIKNLSKHLNSNDDLNCKASFCIGKRSNTEQSIDKYIKLSNKNISSKSFTQNHIQAIKAQNIVRHLKQRKILLEKQQSQRFVGNLERRNSYSFGHKKKFQSFQLKWKNKIEYGRDALQQSIKKFNQARKAPILSSKSPKSSNIHKSFDKQILHSQPISKNLYIKFKQKKLSLCPWQPQSLIQDLQVSLPIVNHAKSIQQWENVKFKN